MLRGSGSSRICFNFQIHNLQSKLRRQPAGHWNAEQTWVDPTGFALTSTSGSLWSFDQLTWQPHTLIRADTRSLDIFNLICNSCESESCDSSSWSSRWWSSRVQERNMQNNQQKTWITNERHKNFSSFLGWESIDQFLQPQTVYLLSYANKNIPVHLLVSKLERFV